MFRKITIIIVALSLVATLCFATGAAEDEGKVLYVAGSEIAVSFDPTVYPGADYLQNMGAAELLFKVDANGIMQPYLAKEAVQIDPYTWHVRLREEAVFWSGAPVDASAVIASLERSRSLDPMAAPYLQGLTFSVVDDYTVEVKTDAPNIDIMQNLSYSQLVIHNTAEGYTYESIETSDYSGMYKISGFEPFERMEYIRNENYWGQLPRIERIVQEEIGDSDARVLAALSGRYHVAMNIPESSVAQFDNSSVSRIVMVPGAQTVTVYLNTEKKALSDYRVRQALGWALDREELILLGLEGMSEPVTVWLGSHPAYSEIKTAFFDSYNPEKAAQLLDEAGWLLADDGYRYKDGERFTFLLRSFRNDKALGEAIQMQLARIGVDVSVQHGDYSLMSTAYETGDWDGAIEGWGTYSNILSAMTTQYGPQGAANYGKFRDPVVDDYLEELAVAENNEERVEIAKELSLYLAEQSPALYICARPQITAISTKLEGFVPHFRQFENVVNPNLWMAD